jgi:hypothetical protein
MSESTDKNRTLKRVGWFIALWAGGVATLTVVGFTIRAVLGTA